MPYEKMIYGLCLRMMGNASDAQDCAQEVLLSAFRAFGGFRAQSSIKTWLYRIAYNTCLDALRRRRGEVSLDALREAGFDPPESRLAAPGEEMERRELRRQIEYALTLLPEDQRAAMILRDFQGLSYQEIASVLSLSEGTVKSRLSRTREKVKNILMEMEQNDGLSVQKGEGRQK